MLRKSFRSLAGMQKASAKNLKAARSGPLSVKEAKEEGKSLREGDAR
jgi:hypothetical protein